MTGFQRARSEEQRGVRRRAILDTAAGMLAEMPVAEVSLNELSRRAGLAKSNVLRYFDSREAVLLELLDDADARLDPATRGRAPPAPAPPASRWTSGFDGWRGPWWQPWRRGRCSVALVSAQASVLEHNISTDVALRFKRAAVADFRELVRVLLGTLPELGEAGAERFIAAASMLTGAIWTPPTPRRPSSPSTTGPRARGAADGVRCRSPRGPRDPSPGSPGRPGVVPDRPGVVAYGK